MSLAAACVSNDSGAMHLAAAVGVPLAALFGPTREHETSPLVRAGRARRSADQPGVVPALHAPGVPDRSPVHEGAGARSRVRHAGTADGSGAAMTPAVFLDRDGTLIEERGYLDRLELLTVFPWTADALRLLNRAGYATVVITNQSAIARRHHRRSLPRGRASRAERPRRARRRRASTATTSARIFRMRPMTATVRRAAAASRGPA